MGSLQRPYKWCDPTSMLVGNHHNSLHLYHQMMFFNLYHKAKLKLNLILNMKKYVQKYLQKMKACKVDDVPTYC